MTDYDALVKESLALFKELQNESGSSWTVINEADGVVLESKPREGSYINCYRVQGQLARSAKDAADTFWGWGKAEWKKLANDVEDYAVVVPELNGNADQRILYQRTALPWPLWHRDVCMLNFKATDENGNFYVLFKSVQHDQVPEKPKEFVRATVLIGGYVFVPDGDSACKVVRIIHLEPNGSIPSAVVNMKANDLHTQMKVFQTLF